MIATNINVPNAMKSSAWIVFRIAEMSTNVSTAVKSIATNAVMKMIQESTFVVDAIPNVARIVFSKGIDRNNCIAQNVSIGVQ